MIVTNLHRPDVTLEAACWDPPGVVRGTVVLLHGGGQTRHSWRHTAQRLADQGWRAIAYDARGHGSSGWASRDGYTEDAFVADLKAVVEGAARPLILVGASLGGQTCIVAQGEEPSLADALVLVDIAPQTNAEGISRVRAFMGAHASGFASLEEAAEVVSAYNPHRPRPATPDGLRKNLRLRRGRWYWHWDPQFLAYGETADSSAGRERRLRAAANITVPTMIVRGAQSDVLTPEGVRQLQSLIPGARAVEVRAGHMLAGDDNDVFTTEMFQFLDDRFTPTP